MNESLIALAGVLIPAAGGGLMWLLSTVNKRIDGVEEAHDERLNVLETAHDKLQEEKVSKEDYYRDQGVQRAILSDIQDDLKNLPDKLLNTLKLLGKI